MKKKRHSAFLEVIACAMCAVSPLSDAFARTVFVHDREVFVRDANYDKKHVPHRKISDDDVKTFNAQCQKLDVRYNESFHDRFLIIDDKELYLIRASLKDLGQKCFAFTKLDAGEIRRIKKTAFGRGENE